MRLERVWLLLPRLKRSALLLLPVLVVSLTAVLVQWNPRLRPRSTWTESDLLEIARNTWHDHAKRCRVILSGPKLPGEDLLRRPTFSDLIEVLEERGRTPATERVLAETLRHGSDEAIRDVLPLTKDWHFDDAVPLMIDRLKERVQWVIQLEHEPRLVSDAAWGLVRAAPVDPRVRRALEWLREAIRGTELTTWVDVDILIAECESHGPPRSR